VQSFESNTSKFLPLKSYLGHSDRAARGKKGKMRGLEELASTQYNQNSPTGYGCLQTILAPRKKKKKKRIMPRKKKGTKHSASSHRVAQKKTTRTGKESYSTSERKRESRKKKKRKSSIERAVLVGLAGTIRVNEKKTTRRLGRFKNG